MKTLLELVTRFWYLGLLVVIAGILEVFIPKIKGYFGEKSVAFVLSSLDETKYKVINNIMLRIGDKTAQIDHVIVSNYGIFVIETKNYKGLIIGNQFDNNWNQIIYKRKENLYNPIKQNYGHIQALKKILSQFGDIRYISIVAFTTNADLKVTSKTDVVYTINLINTIKKYDDECITDFDKDKIFSKLFSLNIDNKENRKAHVQAIRNNLNEKNNKINNDMCPRCGEKLVLRNGKYGQFKGCSNFPKCRFTVK
ncbi:NERD domain-containing protein [Clostridium sp. WILCCON 0269]|uniref:NERD domain-containing protein n=1 Tax=Candidatus Clostridium eludens TaxID=3381663 RepID=A0ABW8SRT6_9CLOT